MELIAEGLTKQYGTVPALTDVSLRSGPWVLAVLGPNGSGKTTLLRILATALRPDRGQIRFAGRLYAGDPRPFRRVIGYLPQDLDLPRHLTARGFLHYVAHLKGAEPEPQVPALLHDLGIDSYADRPLSTLSGGQKRLVALAQALLGRPRLLILDEPLTGLDLGERTRILRLLAGPLGERVVVLSAQIPTDVEATANSVLVLRGGVALAHGSVERVRAHARGQVHETVIATADAERLLQRYPVSRALRLNGEARVRFVGPPPPNLPVTPVDPSLEDAYLWLQQQATR